MHDLSPTKPDHLPARKAIYGHTARPAGTCMAIPQGADDHARPFRLGRKITHDHSMIMSQGYHGHG